MAQGWESTNLDLLSSFGLRIYSPAIWRRVFQALAVIALLFAPILCAQAPTTDAAPLAIVPLDNAHPDQGAKVTGAIEVSHGKAVIAASGAITSGQETTPVTLPRRGVLRVCASTTVKLAADSSVPAGETPGLTMAMDHGAIEISYAAGAATARNADILSDRAGSGVFSRLLPLTWPCQTRIGQTASQGMSCLALRSCPLMDDAGSPGGAAGMQPL